MRREKTVDIVWPSLEKYFLLVVYAKTLVFKRSRTSKPVVDFVFGFFRSFGSMKDIHYRSFLTISQSWRIIGEISSDRTHIRLKWQGWPGNFANHINSVKPLDNHSH